MSDVGIRTIMGIIRAVNKHLDKIENHVMKCPQHRRVCSWCIEWEEWFNELYDIIHGSGETTNERK